MSVKIEGTFKVGSVDGNTVLYLPLDAKVLPKKEYKGHVALVGEILFVDVKEIKH